MKKTFNKAWAWIKAAGKHVWEVADFIEVPSKSAWSDFKKFKQLHDSTISELFTALWTIPVVVVSSWLRLLAPTAYALVAFLLIFGGLLWKLATFWRKAK